MRRHTTAILLLAAVAFSTPLQAAESEYLGLLRARDLTTFGFLRLDMRPAHAVHAPAGTWAIEAELGQQNTWALSRGARDYLDTLSGRRELGPAEVDEILALPGENYLFDMELAQLDFTLHYKFTDRIGGYLVMSGVNYSGGFLDGSIEGFHDAFGFDNNGRPAVRRNGVNLVADIDSARMAFLGAPTSGGMLDPTIGIRYSSPQQMHGWSLVLEAAAKVAFRGQKDFLSTGKTDFGVQATLQRFEDHHAWYVSGSAVYFDGRSSMTPTDPRIVPTLIVGWERKLSPETHLVLQGYVSPSIYTRDDTELDELLDMKYQLSIGVYRRFGRGVLSFAFTENLQNFNNTPDVGLQLGWAYSPALANRGD
ncbi:MAG TPA: DUF3187 family protein [Steroidobacteraceae bacterium]|jgi:hypothetical protein|nr:DUF3187 family protein [Steroidobacteraceae bacterium]